MFYKGITPYIIGRFCNTYPGAKFAVFSYTEIGMKRIADFLSFGASSFIDFRLGRAECLNGLDRVLSGQVYLPENIAEKLSSLAVTPCGAISLTKREKEIMDLLVDELKPRAIAQTLGIKHGTVRIHQSNLYAKCGVHGLSSLVKFSSKMKELYGFSET